MDRGTGHAQVTVIIDNLVECEDVQCPLSTAGRDGLSNAVPLPMAESEATLFHSVRADKPTRLHNSC